MQNQTLSKLGTVILLGTLLVSVPRFTAVFMYAEPEIAGLPPTAFITGLGFGLLLEGGTFFIIRAWALANKKRIKQAGLLLWAFAIQLFVAPVLVAPGVVGWIMSHPSPLSEALLGGSEEATAALWAWAWAATFTPSLLLGAVALAQGIVIPKSEGNEDGEVAPKPAKAPAKPALSRSEPAISDIGVIGSGPALAPVIEAGLNGHGHVLTRVAELQTPVDVAFLACSFCGTTTDAKGLTFRSRSAVAGHQRWCSARPGRS